MEGIAVQSYQAIGVAGFMIYVLSYFLLQIGKIKGTGQIYIWMNLTVASCVLLSLLHNFNLASALIQIFWIMISIVGLIRLNYVASSSLLEKTLTD